MEIHTVELSKYNLDESTISEASTIERWAFFLLYADAYDADRLRELLPGPEFEQAINEVARISQKSEDRLMYDQREKAQRDHQWLLEGARKEAHKEGREEGREEGHKEGRVEGLEQGTLVGRIQMLQQILGEAEGATSELAERDPAELTSMLAILRQRVRDRQA
jgi:flagellar biosynthesis/type III secretory pathway protein FliH